MFPILSMSYWLVLARIMNSHSCLFHSLSELEVRPEFAFPTGPKCRFLPQQQRRHRKRILSVSRREGLEIQGSKSGFSTSTDGKECTGPGLSKSSIRRRRHDGLKKKKRLGRHSSRLLRPNHYDSSCFDYGALKMYNVICARCCYSWYVHVCRGVEREFEEKERRAVNYLL